MNIHATVQRNIKGKYASFKDIKFSHQCSSTKAKAREEDEWRVSSEEKREKDGQVVKGWTTCISREAELCPN